MALFGFNKQKVLSSAEKYVQQGKLQNAIAEYDKVLKNDPKDLTVANTVGDLYSRIGESDKATECFKTVGDAYASQGFTVKAIAMYKKISKLKPSLESVLKLAELYTQQGLFNDARAQYLQVAEEFLKSGELDNAVRIFQKILEMDPENTTMRLKLAEVYVRLGKKTEAWQIFSAAAETMRSKGSLTGADEILTRMLTLDPGNAYALLMQGKNLLESGDAEGAIGVLTKVADLDSNPQGLKDLLKAYLQAGRLSDAGTIAGKLLTVHNDLSAISDFADALMQAGQYESALQVYDDNAERLLAEDPEKILDHLHGIIGHVRDNPASLEKLLALFNKAGENTHTTEVTELLAHASVQAGDFVRARDLYQSLSQREPDNTMHLQNYEQMLARLGGTSGARKLITPEEAVVIVDELEATAPSVHQHYSDEVSLAVRSALTDAELFISYNMPAKALGPLVAALPQAPTDLRLNQRLAALHTRAGRFTEAGVCCRTLQTLYSDAGYPEEATRYGELADRFEERTAGPAAVAVGEEVQMSHGVSEEAVAEEDVALAHDGVAQEFAVEEAPGAGIAEAEVAAPWPTEAPADEVAAAGDEAAAAEAEEIAVPSAEGEAQTDEIDLSSEWEDSVAVEADSPEQPAAEDEIAEPAEAAELPSDEKINETIDEIRFYFAQGLPEQAWAALAKLQTQAPDDARVDQVRAELEAATQTAAEAETANAEESIEEITVDDIPQAEVEEAEVAEPEVAEAAIAQPEIAEPEVAEPEIAEPEIAEVEIPEPEAAVEIEEPAPAPEQEPEPEVVQAAVLQPKVEPPPVVKAAPAPPPKKKPAPKPAPAPEPEVEEPAPAMLQEFVSDLESSLGDNFMSGTVAKPAELPHAEKHVRAAEPELAPVAHTEPVVTGQHAPVLGEFVADLEESLGDDFLSAAPVAAPEVPQLAPKPTPGIPRPVSTPQVSAPAASAAAAAPAMGRVTPAAPPSLPAVAAQAPQVIEPRVIESPKIEPPKPQPPMPVSVPAAPPAAAAKASPFGEEPGVDLAEMFGELKHDLESDVASADEDPETHYNLGIAFREMGLLDEAIGELQKACQSVDRGHAFPQIMQTYTWLAQCFLDKGVPEAAIRWYEKALGVVGIDQETRTALNYELAAAHETAGDKTLALKHFMEVYGSNIDYRDVAERIKALKS
ncbi:MAG: tetratricopeptide repeat protein [Candidatus Sulfotelmatobacter sp.]|jgi:tetratricopeptide (TPR) repeat protein